MPRLDPIPGRPDPNSIRMHAPEIGEAFAYYRAVWQAFTTLDPTLVDLCRLKSAHINDCRY